MHNLPHPSNTRLPCLFPVQLPTSPHTPHPTPHCFPSHILFAPYVNEKNMTKTNAKTNASTRKRALSKDAVPRRVALSDAAYLMSLTSLTSLTSPCGPAPALRGTFRRVPACMHSQAPVASQSTRKHQQDSMRLRLRLWLLAESSDTRGLKTKEDGARTPASVCQTPLRATASNGMP